VESLYEAAPFIQQTVRTKMGWKHGVISNQLYRPEARLHRLTHLLNHEKDHQKGEMYEQPSGVISGALRPEVPSPY
jgi:hypothetical protein